MKNELRTNYLEIRKKVFQKNEKDKKICDLLNSIIEKHERIMIYYPISSEPNILNILNNTSKKFYLPYCNKQNIEPRYLVDLNDLEKDDVNIFSSKIKTNDKLDVVIAPAVACNKQFYRLGYGGGYYDRFLKDKDVLKVVVVYADLLVDINYQEPFDVSFDYIVTEKEILKRS